MNPYAEAVYTDPTGLQGWALMKYVLHKAIVLDFGALGVLSSSQLILASAVWGFIFFMIWAFIRYHMVVGQAMMKMMSSSKPKVSIWDDASTVALALPDRSLELARKRDEDGTYRADTDYMTPSAVVSHKVSNSRYGDKDSSSSDRRGGGRRAGSSSLSGVSSVTEDSKKGRPGAGRGKGSNESVEEDDADPLKAAKQRRLSKVASSETIEKIKDDLNKKAAASKKDAQKQTEKVALEDRKRLEGRRLESLKKEERVREQRRKEELQKEADRFDSHHGKRLSDGKDSGDFSTDGVSLATLEHERRKEEDRMAQANKEQRNQAAFKAFGGEEALAGLSARERSMVYMAAAKYGGDIHAALGDLMGGSDGTDERMRRRRQLEDELALRERRESDERIARDNQAKARAAKKVKDDWDAIHQRSIEDQQRREEQRRYEQEREQRELEYQRRLEEERRK